MTIFLVIKEKKKRIIPSWFLMTIFLVVIKEKKRKNYSFFVSQSGGTCMSMFLKFSHNLLTEAMRQFSTVFQVDQHNAQFLGFSNENLKKFYVKWWDKFNFERINCCPSLERISLSSNSREFLSKQINSPNCAEN